MRCVKIEFLAITQLPLFSSFLSAIVSAFCRAITAATSCHSITTSPTGSFAMLPAAGIVDSAKLRITHAPYRAGGEAKRRFERT